VATSSKTSEIRQAILYDDMLPLVDRQMIAKRMTLNDLERLFHDKMRFRPALLKSEGLIVKNSSTSAILRCSVPMHDQLASLGIYSQLTRCFSAVAELLVLSRIYICPCCTAKLVVQFFHSLGGG